MFNFPSCTDYSSRPLNLLARPVVALHLTAEIMCSSCTANQNEWWWWSWLVCDAAWSAGRLNVMVHCVDEFQKLVLMGFLAWFDDAQSEILPEMICVWHQAQEVNWKDLPLDLLSKVASHGAGQEMRGVCKSWKCGFDCSTKKIIIRVPAGVVRPAPTALPSFERYQSLRSLQFLYCEMANLTGLQGLNKLRDLSLEGCVGVFDWLIRSFTSLSSLWKLDLTTSCIDEEAVFALKGLPLTSLSFKRCYQLGTPTAFASLSGMPLTDLDMSDVPGFIYSSTLSTLSCLSKLNLSDHYWSRVELPRIRNLPSLPLRLSEHFKKGHWGIFENYLSELAGLPLTFLDLGGCECLKDDQLWALQGLPLAILKLNYCPNLSDAGIRALRGLLLADLDVSGLNITTKCLGVLANMPLKRLNVSSCRRLMVQDVHFLVLSGVEVRGP